MPTPKTICTELSVGFGLLGDDPLLITCDDARHKFSNTLSSEHFKTFQIEYRKDPDFYRKFWDVGLSLRVTYFAQTKISQISWEGYRPQAASVSVPKDLMVGGIAISVKADSNVIYNRSPHMMFVSIPKGAPSPGRTEDWFLSIGREEYQSLYEFVHDILRPEFPEDVADLKKYTTAKERKNFAQEIARLEGREKDIYTQRYQKMCHVVAQKSATMFNENLLESFDSPYRNHVEELILRTFFRVGDSEYILCGLDGTKKFAVLVPDLTRFKRSWAIKKIDAKPALDKGQSEVHIDFELSKKPDRESIKICFHIEVRWSHGRFVNNPEGKLYKNFKWTDVAFFRSLHEQTSYNTIRVIGKGGYGIIYEATMPKRKTHVAIKEFNPDRIGFDSADDERRRFAREVELQAELKHLNILPILEYDIRSRRPWFASPLANWNLEEVLPEIEGDLPRTAKILRQILIGLEFAHSQNVIHRDLKPSNILIFDDDIVKIGDFGLGKRIDVTTSEALLTQTSSNSMGTLLYAAPEQLESFRDADERADIYAFGKTFLHLITGKIPTGPFSTISQIDLDSVWAPLIMKCIELDPNQRYQSVREILDDFDKVVRSSHKTT